MTRETFEGFQTRPTLAAHQHFSIIVSLIEAERRAGVHTPRQTAPLPQRWNQSGDGLGKSCSSRSFNTSSMRPVRWPLVRPRANTP